MECRLTVGSKLLERRWAPLPWHCRLWDSLLATGNLQSFFANYTSSIIHSTYNTVLFSACLSAFTHIQPAYGTQHKGHQPTDTALTEQLATISGDKTDLKVGGGHIFGRKYVGRAPPLFLALQVQLVVLVSTFVMVSSVWSVSCLLFFHSWCPPCPAIYKSGRGGTCPHALWSQRHWLRLYKTSSCNREEGVHWWCAIQILCFDNDINILTTCYTNISGGDETCRSWNTPPEGTSGLGLTSTGMYSPCSLSSWISTHSSSLRVNSLHLQHRHHRRYKIIYQVPIRWLVWHNGKSIGHINKDSYMRSSGPCNQDCWHTGISRLRALSVNLRRFKGDDLPRSGLHCLSWIVFYSLAWAHTKKAQWQHFRASTPADATWPQRKRTTKEPHLEKRPGWKREMCTAGYK